MPKTLKENPASEESSEEASISDDDVSKPADGIPKPEPDEEPNSPPVFPLFASVPGYKTYSFEFECFIAEKTNSQAFGISFPHLCRLDFAVPILQTLYVNPRHIPDSWPTRSGTPSGAWTSLWG
jgi:hypothetical protein